MAIQPTDATSRVSWGALGLNKWGLRTTLRHKPSSLVDDSFLWSAYDSATTGLMVAYLKAMADGTLRFAFLNGGSKVIAKKTSAGAHVVGVAALISFEFDGALNTSSLSIGGSGQSLSDDGSTGDLDRLAVPTEVTIGGDASGGNNGALGEYSDLAIDVDADDDGVIETNVLTASLATTGDLAGGSNSGFVNSGGGGGLVIPVVMNQYRQRRA